MRLRHVALLGSTIAALSACKDVPSPSATEPTVVYGPLLLPEGSPFHLSRTPTASHVRAREASNFAYLDGDPYKLDAVQRKNAETGGTSPMGFHGDSAFFRDVAVTAFHTLRASADGQTWGLDILHPNGFREQTGTITFRRNFNGETDCFVSGFSSLCGGEVVFMFTDLNVQCATTGTYVYEALFNGAVHASGSLDFKLVPRIPPGAAPRQFQLGLSAEPYDSSCVGPGGASVMCTGAAGEVKKSIQSKGCAVTSAAMMLAAFGIQTTPVALNKWMNENGAFDPVGQVNFPKFAKMAKDSGKNIKVEKVFTTSNATLRNLICRFGPQVLEVKSLTSTGSQHFVLATGFNDAGTIPMINDPASTTRQDLTDYGSFKSIRQSQRRTATVDTLISGMIVRYYSPGHITLTDPLGRRTGGPEMLAGMPTASYDTLAALSEVTGDGTFGPDEPDQPKVIEVGETPNGDYVVDVDGTGTGTYMLSISLFGPGGRSGNARFPDVPITAGEKHRYKFRYDASAVGGAGPAVPLSGAFSGGGQSASADEMLTYSRPGQRQTTLAAGTTQYSMMIFYSPGMTPSTFAAELNGADVTAMFTPVPGGSQTVLIPLTSGRNVLKLTARGVSNGRNVSDADNIVLKVP